MSDHREEATFRAYPPKGFPNLLFTAPPDRTFTARRTAGGRVALQIPLSTGGHIEVINGERLSVSKYLRLKGALEVTHGEPTVLGD